MRFASWFEWFDCQTLFTFYPSLKWWFSTRTESHRTRNGKETEWFFFLRTHAWSQWSARTHTFPTGNYCAHIYVAVGRLKRESQKQTMSMNVVAAYRHQSHWIQYTHLPYFLASRWFICEVAGLLWGSYYPRLVVSVWLKCRGQLNLSRPFNDHHFLVLPVQILVSQTLYSCFQMVVNVWIAMIMDLIGIYFSMISYMRFKSWKCGIWIYTELIIPLCYCEIS